MPVGLLHGGEDLIDKGDGHALVKKVGHGIHKDHLRLSPSEGVLQARGPELQIETRFERMARNAAKPLGKSLSVAIVTPGADLRAACYGVPRRVRPLDRRLRCHRCPHRRNKYGTCLIGSGIASTAT